MCGASHCNGVTPRSTYLAVCLLQLPLQVRRNLLHARHLEQQTGPSRHLQQPLWSLWCCLDWMEGPRRRHRRRYCCRTRCWRRVGVPSGGQLTNEPSARLPQIAAHTLNTSAHIRSALIASCSDAVFADLLCGKPGSRWRLPVGLAEPSPHLCRRYYFLSLLRHPSCQVKPERGMRWW